MRVYYTLTVEDHLAWYDHYIASEPASIWLRLPVIGPFRAYSRRRRFTRGILATENRRALGVRTIALSASGVREFSCDFDFFGVWQDIARADLTGQHLFLAHPSMNARIIPLRAFQNESHRDSFVSFALHHAPPLAKSHKP
jgi:hypothetical protein